MKELPSNVEGGYLQLTSFENLAYKYAWHGWRGSQFIWSLCKNPVRTSQLGSEGVLLPSGFKIKVDSKDWTKRTIYQGTYERALLHFLNSLKLNDLVVDVGANIGVTLWHSLKNSNINSTFLAFEPSVQCFGDLELTTARILNSGKMLKFALGSENTDHKLFGVNNENHSGLASLIKRDNQVGESLIVQVRKLDSVLEVEKAKGAVSLLKIDTEGYEAAVLLGARNLLESKKVEIIVLEVSPNLCDVSYLEDLNEILGNLYTWLIIEEIGVIKRRPILRKISHSEAANLDYQFNIAIFRSDKLDEYARDPCSIKLT
jgi:FkbM family methyltransferase